MFNDIFFVTSIIFFSFMLFFGYSLFIAIPFSTKNTVNID